MALHARAANRQFAGGAGARRQVPLRAVLVILAVLPSAAMLGLWAVESGQLYNNWRDAGAHETVLSKYAAPVLGVYADLQAERRLTAAALADSADYKAKLDRQRQVTDAAVMMLAAPNGATLADFQTGVRQIEQSLGGLSAYRSAVDQHTFTQQQAYDAYTGLIASDLALFNTLSNVGLADVNYHIRPLADSLWGMEMVSREDAVLMPAVVTGTVSGTQRSQVAQLVGAQQFIYDDKVVPLAPGPLADQYRALVTGPAWQQKTLVEQAFLGSPGNTGQNASLSASAGQQWLDSNAKITAGLLNLTQIYGTEIDSATAGEVHDLAMKLIVNSIVSAIGILLVVALTLILTGLLRRRIRTLRGAAQSLQTRLPDVVERLRRGEPVDTDAELPEVRHGRDELGMLGQALNAARGTALETAVRQVEQYRGFERLLQRIARRTQLLIGLQMKRLIEMERRHEDAEVLEGLFDLDHLTARLRRYEENLVILGGGQPQRRWRTPVPMLDVLRAAQGEVQDYRRIHIEAEPGVWLTDRAIGIVVHVLAELMENAVTFSKPPTPVEVTASRVSRGLAVEIEDRGIGMEPEQYSQANALLADPPRMDVISQADDARLGLFVVARLASGLGVTVELRPSPFGGTRAVVLLPSELVRTSEPAEEAEGKDSSANTVAQPAFDTGRHAGAVTGSFSDTEDFLDGTDFFSRARMVPKQREPSAAADGRTFLELTEEDPAADSAAEPRLEPLPQRVRQMSVVSELREPRRSAPVHPQTPDSDAPPRREPGRSGASIGAFQRQSRLTRRGSEDGFPPPDHSPVRITAPEED